MILIRPGDRIPPDGVIVEGRSQIDTSPVTVEPVPVNVYPGTEVYSGCVNDQGSEDGGKKAAQRVHGNPDIDSVEMRLPASRRSTASLPSLPGSILRWS